MRALLTLLILYFAQPGWATIDPERLAAIKAATPFITVDTKPGPSSGSGFLIQRNADRGLVVTNAHVVKHGDNRDIEVVFFSGTRDVVKFPAKILSLDRATDLAVLEINGKGIPKPVFLGDSSSVIETQELFIVGYPFGTRLATNRDTPTITVGRGTVSSRRLDINDHTYLLQVDGDINPGNSGGPVTDSKGNVIGVSVAKVTQSNIGFAIPSQFVQELLNGHIGNLYAERVADGARLHGETLDPLDKINSAQLIYGLKDKFTSNFDKSSGTWKQPSGDIVDNTVTVNGQRVAATIKGNSGDTLMAQLVVTTEQGKHYAAPFEIQLRKLSTELKGPSVLTKGKRKNFTSTNESTPVSELNDEELVTRVLTQSGINEFIDNLTGDADLLFQKDEDTADDKSGQSDIKARLREILSESWERDRVYEHYISIFKANLNKAHARTMLDLFSLPVIQEMHVNVSAFSSIHRDRLKKFQKETKFDTREFKDLLKKYQRINKARKLSATMHSSLQTTTLAVSRLVNEIQPLSIRVSDDQVATNLQHVFDNIERVLGKGTSILLAMQYKDIKPAELDDYLSMAESDAYLWFSNTEHKAFTTLLAAKLALAETDLRKLLSEAQHEAAGVKDVGSLDNLTPEQAIEKLFEAYEKEAVVHYLIKKGDGNISIKTNDSIRQTMGRPRQDLISPETILIDMKRIGIDIKTLAKNLDEQAIEAAYRDRRLNARSAARNARSRSLNILKSRTQQLEAAVKACAAQCYVQLDQCSATPDQKVAVQVGGKIRYRSCSSVYSSCTSRCRRAARAQRQLIRAQKKHLQ